MYNLSASPVIDYDFVTWQKNNLNTTIAPSLTDKNVTFKYVDAETVVAEFVYNPPPPPPPPPPPSPLLTGVIKTIFIPNAFTPNADHNNDVFNVKLGKDAIGMNMTIFDRWGKMLFESNRIAEGWDGTYKGKDADMGTYQYVIKVRYRDQSVETYKGDISLVR
jgi:gliding motility-associated-like protein